MGVGVLVISLVGVRRSAGSRTTRRPRAGGAALARRAGRVAVTAPRIGAQRPLEQAACGDRPTRSRSTGERTPAACPAAPPGSRRTAPAPSPRRGHRAVSAISRCLAVDGPSQPLAAERWWRRSAGPSRAPRRPSAGGRRPSCTGMTIHRRRGPSNAAHARPPRPWSSHRRAPGAGRSAADPRGPRSAAAPPARPSAPRGQTASTSHRAASRFGR